MPQAILDNTPPAAPLTSGKAALAMLEINNQLAKLAGLPADHPDAELIQSCIAHPRNIIGYWESTFDGKTDDDPAWAAYDRTRDAISDTAARTAEGMVAKAWAAKAEAVQPDGREDPDFPSNEWAWGLLNDIIDLNAPPNPDAHLIALCQEFIDIERTINDMFPGKQNAIDDDKTRSVAAAPLEARQEALVEEIAGIPFKTMEGARMIARAAACWAKDVIENGFAELGGLHGDLYFTLVKGLIGENVA